MLPQLGSRCLHTAATLFAWTLHSEGLADAAKSWQIGLQDPATPIKQGVIDLHHGIVFVFLGHSGFRYVDRKKNIVACSRNTESSS